MREGDRVALLVAPSPTYVEAVLALLARGIVPIPLDPRLTTHERERILDGLDPTLVVTEESVLDDLLAAHRPSGPVTDWLPRARPMHCTSGTTGTPKGVWSGLLPPTAARALVEEERELWGFAPDDVNLVLSPLYHSAPLRFAMGTLLAGGRIVLPGPFDPGVVTTAIERERPTTAFCVPTHLQRLFAHWDEVGAPDLSSFRLLAHAGAPCPGDVKRRLVATFPPGSTWEFYGSTEGQFTACRSEEWLERPGTVGRARPGRVLSTDPDGLILVTSKPALRFSTIRPLDPQQREALRAKFTTTDLPLAMHPDFAAGRVTRSGQWHGESLLAVTVPAAPPFRLSVLSPIAGTAATLVHSTASHPGERCPHTMNIAAIQNPTIISCSDNIRDRGAHLVDGVREEDGDPLQERLPHDVRVVPVVQHRRGVDVHHLKPLRYHPPRESATRNGRSDPTSHLQRRDYAEQKSKRPLSVGNLPQACPRAEALCCTRERE